MNEKPLLELGQGKPKADQPECYTRNLSLTVDVPCGIHESDLCLLDRVAVGIAAIQRRLSAFGRHGDTDPPGSPARTPVCEMMTWEEALKITEREP